MLLHHSPRDEVYGVGGAEIETDDSGEYSLAVDVPTWPPERAGHSTGIAAQLQRFLLLSSLLRPIWRPPLG
jgi:hypothetical protein